MARATRVFLYDTNGTRVTGEYSLNGAGQAVQQSVTVYDAGDAAALIAASDGRYQEFFHDAQGRVTAVANKGCSACGGAAEAAGILYDANDRATAAFDAAGNQLGAYVYDAEGRPATLGRELRN